MKQLDILGNEIDVKKSVNKAKRNWENAFQRWSNKHFINCDTTHYGVCGCGSMCDWCQDNSYGRPCVRALNEMCREKQIAIDYNNRDFESIWNM